MSRPIPMDYDQIVLFPPTLEDFVPKDHPARFVRELVDQMAKKRKLQSMGFQMSVGIDGRPHFPESMLLKAWIFGYMTGIRGTRELERGCEDSLALMWLTCNLKPDHVTLWRFFHENLAGMKKVFRSSVKAANRMGLVGLVLQAVDGTKIHAQCSDETAWYRETKVKQLELINNSIERGVAEIQKSQKSERAPSQTRLPTKLQDRLTLRDRIDLELKSMDEDGRSHMHPEEPEARMMKQRREGTGFSYNGQTVVDAKVGIITNAEVVSDETDSKQLVRQIEGAAKNLGETTRTTLADAGYNNGEQLSEAKNCGHNVIVAEKGQPSRQNTDLSADKFIYDTENKVVICPRNETLTFEQTKKDKLGRPMSVFRCHAWRSCPLAAECSKDKRGRSIEIGRNHDAVVENRKRLRSPEGKALMRLRGAIVEQPYGWIKENYGFRRFTMNGLDASDAQWSLVCAAQNFWKIFRHGIVRLGQLARAPALVAAIN